MNRLIRIALTTVAVCQAVCVCGQITKSALNKREFNKHWVVESESADYSVSFYGDTVELVSPKGLTLWRKEKLSADMVIEYDACIVNTREGDRTSDLNCFWLASDPQATDVFKRMKVRGGVFLNSYTLQLYYMGYGGNYNTTTRFRRYDGNAKAVTESSLRPPILKEYTDSAHLLKPNHWYHIKLMQHNGRVSCYIDGKCIVSYLDPEPLTEGWFGFRTTWTRSRITNFKVTRRNEPSHIPLAWIGDKPAEATPVSWGIPFAQGEMRPTEGVEVRTSDGAKVEADNDIMALWPDGSVKWLGVAAVVPPADSVYAVRSGKHTYTKHARTAPAKPIESGRLKLFVSEGGDNIIDSLLLDNRCVARNIHLFCSTQNDASRPTAYADYRSRITSATVEHVGVKTVVRITGEHLMPFEVRLYIYKGSDRIRLVHTLIYTADHQREFVNALGLRANVSLAPMLYNRHVAFAVDGGRVWSEPVQPLVGRVPLRQGIQSRQMSGATIDDTTAFDERGKKLLRDWASWGDYRLMQTSADGYTVRKRTSEGNTWVGTYGGRRADGVAYVGSTTGGLVVALDDFRQSAPSGFEVTGARTHEATVTCYLWNPEAQPMDMRHYDDVAHGLASSYEDVQEGFSSPYGIARTSTLYLVPQSDYNGKEAFASVARELGKTNQLVCTPRYLHSKRAFGVWSLPDTVSPLAARVEKILDNELSYYKEAVERHKWYGFWNYGDFMHTYDPVRHEWLYDVGGYAWDNTELATNMWLWYSFLRTGRDDIWTLAEAMTRHTCEVDVYHRGPHAMLGSRHNVSHWGCGAKEARISQAAWNRFYYYLTTDERSGDLMAEVRDAEQKLYTLDPMRLAEPRSKYPCGAPARLRIGPDWLAYAGNWFAEWERYGQQKYLDKITSGMKSIASLPRGLFTGNKALGYDPATGIVSFDGDTTLQNTNHLLSIMGGFEVMTEMMLSIDEPLWNKAWLAHADEYRMRAHTISKNRFRVSRLEAFAAWKLRQPQRMHETWQTLLKAAPAFGIDDVHYTNDAATWGLDAIYMLELLTK